MCSKIGSGSVFSGVLLLVGWSLVSLAACGTSPAGSAPASVETRLRIEVVDPSGAPVAGAAVGVSNPLSETGSVWIRTTNSLGIAEILESVPDASEWLPVSITIQPSAGSGLAALARPDSMRFQPRPAAAHVVVIALDSL